MSERRGGQAHFGTPRLPALAGPAQEASSMQANLDLSLFIFLKCLRVSNGLGRIQDGCTDVGWMNGF